jgi:hypothetical protein
MIGFMNLEFEGNALYVSEEFFRHGATQDALWLDVEGMTVKPPFHQGYVIVQGTFDGERRGHLGMFAGTIQRIKRLEAWH